MSNHTSVGIYCGSANPLLAEQRARKREEHDGHHSDETHCFSHRVLLRLSQSDHTDFGRSSLICSSTPRAIPGLLYRQGIMGHEPDRGMSFFPDCHVDDGKIFRKPR